MCTYGRPGAAYLDFPADMIQGTTDPDQIIHLPAVPPPPRTLADPTKVSAAVDALLGAKRPLVIIGKG